MFRVHRICVLVPWIRRVLVVGGSSSGQPTCPFVKELAPVSGLQDDARALIEYGVIPRNFNQVTYLEYDHSHYQLSIGLPSITKREQPEWRPTLNPRAAHVDPDHRTQAAP